MTRSFGPRSIALAVLVLGFALPGCSNKQATANKTPPQKSEQTSNPAANALTPAAPSPIPIPYPASSVEARDVATGQATGKRMHKPMTLAE